MDTAPLGKGLGEVIVRAAGEEVADAIVMLRAADAVVPFASLTAKVKVLVPAFAGVPEKTPDALRPRPVLHPPEQLATDQL